MKATRHVSWSLVCRASALLACSRAARGGGFIRRAATIGGALDAPLRHGVSPTLSLAYVPRFCSFLLV